MQNRVKLLIADDSEDTRIILKEICQKLGSLDIFEAENGQEAMQVCDKKHPQIVLMDMMMPVMDGATATKKIKEKYPSTVIIVITSIIDKDTEEQIIKAGAAAYITKPIDSEMIYFKLKNHIELIQPSEDYCKIYPDKKAVNPFSREIRSFKTIFQIENPDDMMDFGLWLLSWCASKEPELMYPLDVFVGYLYVNMQKSLKNSESITVIIEENFEELFVSMVMDSALVLEKLEYINFTRIYESIIVRENTMYMHINLEMLRDCLKAKLEHCETLNLKIENETIELKQTYKPKEEIRAISSEEKMILRKSFVEKTSAVDYVADIGGDVLEEIISLESLDAEWIDSIDVLRNNSECALFAKFADSVLARYANTINNLFEFASLGHALNVLGDFIKSDCAKIVENDKAQQLIDLLSHLGSDLSSWRMHVFVHRDTQDIHYLDSSFFSSCMQIEGIVSEKVLEQDDDNDLELF